MTEKEFPYTAPCRMNPNNDSSGNYTVKNVSSWWSTCKGCNRVVEFDKTCPFCGTYNRKKREFSFERAPFKYCPHCGEKLPKDSNL